MTTPTPPTIGDPAHAGVATTNAAPLTQEQVQRILIQPLLEASVFLASGPRIFDVTAAGRVRIPKLVSSVEPSWTGESEQIDETSVEFGEVVLLDGVQSLKSITRYSNEMARSSVVALDAAIQARMVYDCAQKLDRTFISSDGAPDSTGKSTIPVGLLNWTGVDHIVLGSSLGFDDLMLAWQTALLANVDPTKLKWMMRPETFIGLRKIKDTQGRYILTPDPSAGNMMMLLGAPVTVTKHVPITTTGGTTTTSAILWDPSQVAVARDLSPSVVLLRERYAEFDEQAIRVVARYDTAPLNEGAVVVLDAVTV